MRTKGFAMMRKILMAAVLAIVLAAGTPAWAGKMMTPANTPIQHTTAKDDAAADEPAADESADAPVADSSSAPAASGQLGTDTLRPGEALANFGPSSGTVVGNRALELRDEVLRLRSSVNLNAGEFSLLRSNGAAGAVQYHSTVAAITARLQNGTTRGNPILLRQWDEAEASLNEVTASLNRLNSLQTAVAADSSLAAYLLESIQAAFQLSGAVDEDHDQLKLIRDEVSRMVVQLDYLRNQVADDIQRQTTYLTTERSNLQALAFAITRGELLGSSLANRPVIVNQPPVMMLPNGGNASPSAMPFGASSGGTSFAPTPSAAPTAPVTTGRLGPSPMSPRDYMAETGQAESAKDVPPASAIDGAVAPTAGRLLVLIRYNQPNVEYEQQLSQAVSTALQRKPDADFTVVAVSPSNGEPSELATAQQNAGRNAEAVKRSLVQLGLSPSRIAMSSTQVQSAQTAEVHVYVR
jgi:hypothetical protein